MKRRNPLTTRQVLVCIAALLIFSLLTLFLFRHHTDEQAFSTLTGSLFREEMCSSTLSMHYSLAHPEDFGITDYEPILPCYDKTAADQATLSLKQTITKLKSISPDQLSTRDAYLYSLLNRYLSNRDCLNRFPYYEEPLSPSSGMQSQLPVLLAEYTFRNKRDVEDYLCLLEQTDAYFASLLSYEQQKAKAGLLMPASSLEKVKTQCDTIVTLPELAEGTHFLQTTFSERLQPLVDEGELTTEEADQYCSRNDRLLSTVLVPAYEALADGLFLLEDGEIPLEGLAAKPDGAAYYTYLLRAQTGSYRSPKQVEQLLTQAFQEEWKAIYEIISSQPDVAARYSRSTTSDLPLEDPRDILSDLQARMVSDFPSMPHSHAPKVTVKQVSPNLQQYCAPAFYLTAPLDDTENNVIYINGKNAPNRLELYTTLAHEGYPGHLYQTVYCNRQFLDNQENPVREILWYGGYLEGWALYVEFLSFDYATELLKEQGRYPDAYSIQLEKHNRSLQLCLYSLLDMMIHYENASVTRVSKVLEGAGISNPDAVNAIYTYIAEEPCNYPKYYLGYLEILQLQKKAKALWGDSYSDYDFHKFYLDCGPSDFTSLEERLSSETVRKKELALRSALSSTTCSSLLNPSVMAFTIL